VKIAAGRMIIIKRRNIDHLEVAANCGPVLKRADKNGLA